MHQFFNSVCNIKKDNFEAMKINILQKLHLILILATTCCGSVSAQDGGAFKSLSIFKNGQSFAIKESVIETNDKAFKLTKLPNALFGTYWFAGINGAIINSVTSKKEVSVDQQERKANSFIELLHANKGTEISVTTSDNKVYKGIVEDFDLPEEINSKVQLAQLELTENYRGQYGFDKIFTTAAPVLLLKMNGSWLGIDPATIKSIEFGQKPKRITTANIAVQKPVVTLRFDKEGKQSFRYMYLQNGLSWTPVYQLQMISETEALLNLQAEVSNDVEDIKNTNIDFVVGAPNFSKAVGPATLLNLGMRMAEGSFQNSNMYQYRNDMSMARRAASEESFQESLPNIAANENEDLYFYTLKNLSLEKGERAQFPLFSHKVKIHHYYQCDLPQSPFNNDVRLNAEEDATAENDDIPIEMNTPITVKHFIDVYNNTESPFTSGPVLILSKDATALAQDVLPFIPRNTQAPVFITASPDIVVKERERIAELKRKNKKIDGYDYALATIAGTIEIQNTKSKTVALQLKKIFTGKMITATVKYHTNILSSAKGMVKEGIQVANFYTTLGSSGKTTIKYSYQIHLRE